MNGSVEQIRRQKAQVRREAMRRRAELSDKDGRSLVICQKLLALPEFQAARTILFYVHYGDEVRTQPLLRWLLGESPTFGAEPAEAKASSGHESRFPQETIGMNQTQTGRPLLVPYCQGGELNLFRLRAMAELAPGSFGILEPMEHLRTLPDRQATIQEVDLAVVPGVAFDGRGGRLGHGRGYYDRLLVQARPDTILVGLAYQCQIFPELPMLPSDVRMHKIITESQTYLCRRPK